MHINPKIEPWLEKLLDGVQNSNSGAELSAPRRYHASTLRNALVECLEYFESRADAEYLQDGPNPNEEMKMQMMIAEVLEKAGWEV